LPTGQRLNITNGDSAAGTMSEAGIEGKIIPWRDVLHEGPVDSSLSLEDLSKQRARFIAGNNWDDFAHISGDFTDRDRVIRQLDYFDEVVLWFEDDLYDQLQLIQLLDFFGRPPAKNKKLSVIVVDGYIPPLTVAELKQLETKRPPVRQEQLDLARRAWKAFGSKDPTSIEKLLNDSTSALPYLARALTRELEEFPSTVNGLSRSEREALTAIQEGHSTPVAAFLEVAKKQESVFLGDLIFYSYLERLSGRDNPLVTLKDGSPVIAPSSNVSREFVESELVLTPLGREVLAGKKDWQTVNKKSRWLGGVEIVPGKAGWRWDPAERRLSLGGSTSTRSSTPKQAKKKSAPPTSKKTAKPTKRIAPKATKSGRPKSKRVAKKSKARPRAGKKKLRRRSERSK
jgi:hypothetical protein